MNLILLHINSLNPNVYISQKVKITKEKCKISDLISSLSN